MSWFLNEIFKKNISNMNNEELWDHFKKCLIEHDWSFEYTEDYRYWQKGVQERNYIMMLCDVIGPRAKQEYLKYGK